MKFFLATALCVAVASLAQAEKCEYSKVSASLQALGTPIAKCMTATGNSYNVARATAPPTAEQAAAICEKCDDFVDAVEKITWPDCTMEMGGKDQTITAYFDAMISGCKSASATTSPTGSSHGSNHTDHDHSTMTKEPEGSQQTGSAGSEMEDSSDNDSHDVMSSPSPVPSPTSTGYSVSVGIFAASAVATTLVIVA